MSAARPPLAAEPTPELVVERLRRVLDPELGVNVVDLGLVREVVVDDGGAIAVRLTLTTPACPLGGYLEDRIRAVLEPLPAVEAVEVAIEREPPWRPDDMSDAAKEQLGWRR